MKIKSFVFSYVTNLKTYTTCPDLSGEKKQRLHRGPQRSDFLTLCNSVTSLCNSV